MENNKKQRKPKGQLVALIIYLLAGVALGLLMTSGGEMELWQRLLRYAALFAGVYVAAYLQIIVHEAGHLVFGLLSGYRFCSFRIASLMLIRQNGRLFFKRMSLAGTGGQCLMSPPDMQDGRIPFVMYNFGGSLMNLMFTALMAVVYFILPQTPVLSDGLLLVIIMGLCIALTNGIPLRMANVNNDGHNAISLGKDAAALKAFWAQLRINEQTGIGVRLRDMPQEWFELPEGADMSNTMIVTMGVFACNKLMDEGRYDEADARMAELLSCGDGLMGIYRSLLVCDRIWCELMKEGREQIIDSMLDDGQLKFMKAMKKFPSVIRTKYVLALLKDNNEAEARRISDEFEKVARSYPYASDIEGERNLMLKAKQKYQEKHAQV